jgi:hypothetical protein
VVLPGEDRTAALGTQRVDYDRQDDWLLVDASGHSTDDTGALTDCLGYDACRSNSSRVVGLGMGDDEDGPHDFVTIRVGTDRSDPANPTPIVRDFPTGLVYHSIEELTVELGTGADDFTVHSTHTSVDLEEVPTVTETALLTGDGDDHVQVDTIDGATQVVLGDGDDTGRIGAGEAEGEVTGIAAELAIVAGDGDDDVEVDARQGSQDEDEEALRADLALDRLDAGTPASAELTELEMPGLVRHDATLESFRIRTGPGDDVANVRGALAGLTTFDSGAGDDRTFVSSSSVFGTDDDTPGILGGHLDHIVGAVHVDAGADDNFLMVSDRSGTTGRTASASEGSFAVDGLGAITYDASGTFSRGVTVWLSDVADTVTVTGARSDEAAPTFLAWEGREEVGEARTLTTLNAGGGADHLTVGIPAGHGLLVANLEQGDDTLLGGGSATGFAAFGGAGADRIQSGGGDDVVFGDFGRIEHRDGDALVGILGVPDRMDLVSGRAMAPDLVGTCNTQPAVSDTLQVSGCSGTDNSAAGRIQHTGAGAPPVPVRNWISVGAGDDVAFGGRDADWIDAAGGRNALVGDHGSVRRVLPSALGGPRTIRSSDGSIDHAVLEEDFAYVVDVHDSRGGSPDVVLGGDARDWVFAGQGDDLVNAQGGDDIVFGGDGRDVLWGGADDDRIYGGWGDDLVDLKTTAPGTGRPRTTTDGWPISTSWWAGAPLVGTAGWEALAPVTDTDESASSDNGSDLVHGGEGPDVMLADVGGAGPVAGDRLVDWLGSFNLYYVCDGAYGAGRVVRLSSPSVVTALQQLAAADGADGQNGTQQLAIPTSGNTGRHPAHPGNNFGC